jgi:hypothetical protein
MNSLLKSVGLIIIILTNMIVFHGCKIEYSTTGASLTTEKTISVIYFPNRADIVNPTLSSEFTEMLKDKFISQTKLEMITKGGDLNFEGEISQYFTRPAAITGDEKASLTRLTIGIKVSFTNEMNPDNNFESNFTQYEDFDARRSLDQVEGDLVPQILDKIIEDIFNASVVNW